MVLGVIPMGWCGADGPIYLTGICEEQLKSEINESNRPDDLRKQTLRSEREVKENVKVEREGKKRCEVPNHYNRLPLEVIDIIAICVSDCPSAYEGYCLGNALKYLMRFRHKGNPVQDLQKAIDYIQFIQHTYETKD